MAVMAAAILGLGLGVKHAFEADHVAAVCALVSRDAGAEAARRSPADRALIPRGVLRAISAGALWGAGHGAVIILAGGALVWMGASVPPRIAAALDAAVAVMLIGLGVLAIRGALRREDPRPHAHGHHHHHHPTRRPFLVGLVHGASGTAALTLLVTTQIPVRVEALTFVFLFGAASILGMAVAAGCLAWPLHQATVRAPTLARRLRGASGLGSIAAGLAVAWTVVGPAALS